MSLKQSYEQSRPKAVNDFFFTGDKKQKRLPKGSENFFTQLISKRTNQDNQD